MGHFDTDEVKPLFPKGYPLSLKLAVFAVLSVGFMVVHQRTHLLRPLQKEIDAAVVPIQFLATVPAKLSRVSVYFTSRHDLLAENKQLQRKQLVLNAKMQKLASLRSENAHIRALLKSSKRIDNRVLITKISAASPGPYRHNVVLDKGNTDGVYKGQAVLDSHGIMGQVVSVNPFSSTAMLITDANNGIPVSVNRNGLQTVAEGSGNAISLRLPYLPSNTDIKPGDLLVSSGMGGRYPAGYPVATVTHVKRQPGEDFLSVQAKPAAHLHREREALLVWSASGGNRRREAKQNRRQLAENIASRQP